MSRILEVLQRAERSREVLNPDTAPLRQSPWRQPVLQATPDAHVEFSHLVQRLFLLPACLAPHVVVFAAVDARSDSGAVCAVTGDRLAARTTSSVCILDANLRSPSLHQKFALQNHHGFTDLVLNCDWNLRDVVNQLAAENLWLLTSGSPAQDAEGFVHSEQTQSRLAELRKNFEYVLIAAPPLARYSDAITLSHSADGVVLIVRANATRRDAACKVKQQLAAADIPIVAAVISGYSSPIPGKIHSWLS